MKRRRSGEGKEELKEDERVLKYKPMTWEIQRPPVDEEEVEEKGEEGKGIIGFPKILSDYYRVIEEIKSDRQIGSWIEPFTKKSISLPVGKIYNFFERLENKDFPLLYREEKIAPEELLAYNESLGDLPMSLIDLIHSIKGPDAPPYKSCHDPEADDGYEVCKKLIENLQEHSYLPMTNIHEFLCPLYCLLKNLPTHTLTKYFGQEEDDEPENDPFMARLGISFENVHMRSIIIYDEEKKNHEIDFWVSIHRKGSSDPGVKFSLPDISVDELMKIISFFGRFSRINLIVDKGTDQEIVGFGNSKAGDLWEIVGNDGITLFPI